MRAASTFVTHAVGVRVVSRPAAASSRCHRHMMSVRFGHPRCISTVAEGTLGTMGYRLRFNDDSGHEISPWHDIQLSSDSSSMSLANHSGIFNAVFEIPKMTKMKMEVATKETKNPIAQDVKKGKLRDYHGPICTAASS